MIFFRGNFSIFFEIAFEMTNETIKTNSIGTYFLNEIKQTHQIKKKNIFFYYSMIIKQNNNLRQLLSTNEHIDDQCFE